MTATIDQENALTYTESHFRGETVHRVLVIEYHHGQPHSVVTDHGTFDFDYCRRDGLLYFSQSGFGGDHTKHDVSPFCKPSPPPARIWTAPEVSLYRWESAEKPEVPVDDVMLLAMGYVRLKRPLLLKSWRGEKSRNPFEAGEEHEGQIEYCSVCDDNLPDAHLCNHLRYCEGCVGVMGAGGDPPSEESIFSVFDWLASLDPDKVAREHYLYNPRILFPDPIRAVEALLLADKFPPRCHDSNQILSVARDSNQWDEMEEGFCWLQTLRRDTPKANAKTLAWILAWRLSKDERAKAKERKRLVAELQTFATTTEKGREILAALGIPGGKRADLPLEMVRAVLSYLKE